MKYWSGMVEERGPGVGARDKVSAMPRAHMPPPALLLTGHMDGSNSDRRSSVAPHDDRHLTRGIRGVVFVNRREDTIRGHGCGGEGGGRDGRHDECGSTKETKPHTCILTGVSRGGLDSAPISGGELSRVVVHVALLGQLDAEEGSSQHEAKEEDGDASQACDNARQVLHLLLLVVEGLGGTLHLPRVELATAAVYM